MEDHKIYKSEVVLNNHSELCLDCEWLNRTIVGKFGEATRAHAEYNVFAVATPKKLWAELYSELRSFILDFLGTESPLCYQSWLNYHPEKSVEQVLGWHTHTIPWHGYISIDPQNSITEFEDGLEIENEIGNVYIGPGNKRHRVKVLSYRSPRITIGFDVNTFNNSFSSNYGMHPLYV